MLTAKENFLKFQPNAADELKAHREDSWLTVSAIYAISEMVYAGATAEQLQGARQFVRTLQNLWDKGEPAVKLPVQSLKTFNE
jgi:hypothetical protein